MNIRKLFKRVCFEFAATCLPAYLLKTSLFSACVKEAVVFTFLVLVLILVHIFGSKRDIACCPVLVFCRGVSNAICYGVLYLLYEGLNILIYDGTVTVQLAAVQDSTLPETSSQYISRKWVVPIWEQGADLNRDV